MATDQNSNSFVKIMFASLLGFILATVVLSFLSFIALMMIASASKTDKGIEENSVLVVKLNSPIVEQDQNMEDFDLSFLGISPSATGLNKILAAIKDAKSNDDIKGILLDLDIVNASLSEIEEIRNAILDFKSSGKFVIAHADNYSHTSYYLATAADKIYMTPTGVFLWKGMASQVMFMKGLLDKLEIQPVVIRHGKFKSAVEPYILDSMSTENRLQLKTALDNYWNQYLDDVAKARNLDKKTLNDYANKLTVSSSQKAFELGFIDDQKFRSDVVSEIKKLLNIAEDKKLKVVTIGDYISKVLNPKDLTNSFDTKSNKIAIIYAEGQIISGKSSNNNMGDQTIVDAIRKAEFDKTIKAIVLRVNSPGGSALASEIILHEIENTKKIKPIVVSMGKYAASGGYYISCEANYIYAEPYTLTGSIGVFGLMFNAQKLLNDKLGVSFQVVKTNDNADFGNFARPLSPDEQTFFQAQIEEIYDKFISHVALGRNVSKQYVDSIGQGRIWTTQDAVRLKLVDSEGSIQDAINKAAQLANITDYKVVELPKVKSFFDKIAEQMDKGIKIKQLGIFYDLYQQAQQIQYMQGSQMMLPYHVDVY